MRPEPKLLNPNVRWVPGWAPGDIRSQHLDDNPLLMIGSVVGLAIIMAPILAWFVYFAAQLPIWSWYAALFPSGGP